LLEAYKIIMFKDKAIYHNLNKLFLKNNIYGGFFWSPKASEGDLREGLK